MGVTKEEIGRVDEHPAIRLRRDLETPVHGGREGATHGRNLAWIITNGAVAIIRLHEKQARAHA